MIPIENPTSRTRPATRRWSVPASAAALLLLIVLVPPVAVPTFAHASETRRVKRTQGAHRATIIELPAAATSTGAEAGSLEAAAGKAGETGRKIAMSLIGLGFAVASVVLVFRRNFREAVGVFAVGLVAIVLATPTGVNVLHDTVNTLFGSS